MEIILNFSNFNINLTSPQPTGRIILHNFAELIPQEQ